MIRSLLSRVGKAFRGGEEGAMMIEYVLVAGIVSVGLVAAFILVGWDTIFGTLGTIITAKLNA